MIQPNKDELRLWIAALRSGDYPQSEGGLQNEFGYCCLGVGCKAIIPKDKLLYDNKGYLEGVSPHFQPNAPQWLKDINADFGEKHDDSLIGLNDSTETTFEQIADLLEKTYLNDGTE